jgi:hypothetical protein
MTHLFKQVGGSHYKMAIEPWDYVVANNLGYLEGNVIKYVTRYKQKGGLQDLQKAQHYIEKLMEVERERLRSPLDPYQPTSEADTRFITEKLTTPSTTTVPGASYREQQVNQCRVRYEGYGKPLSLGDII